MRVAVAADLGQEALEELEAAAQVHFLPLP